MASNAFERQIKNSMNMDITIAGNQSGLMRWQTKRMNGTDPLVDLSVNSFSKNTPGKNGSGTKGSPRKSKTPTYSDRFIPVYNNRSLDAASYAYNYDDSEERNSGGGDSDLISPSSATRQHSMVQNLHSEIDSNNKVLHFTNQSVSLPPQSSNIKCLFDTGAAKASTAKKGTRYISSKPERILDAPEFINDYYLNLLDWSVTNLMAVALNRMIYIWSLESGEINELLEIDSDNSKDYICSIAFTECGEHLAIGTSMNNIQIWDVKNQKKMRTMEGHSDRVGSLSWNHFILSSGSRSGQIHHYDVRYERYHIATLIGHNLEVCGLKWSADGKYLASGGNDNILNIWSMSTVEPEVMGAVFTTPLHRLTKHTAAIKGLSFCPWQPSLLASGGGSMDKHINFWNCSTGECVKSVNTHSQVCSLLWSKNYKELISSHGSDDYQLSIWKYPEMTKVKDLKGHTSRAVHLAMSPDGNYVASMSGDETLCLWKCFEKEPVVVASKKLAPSSKSSSSARRSAKEANAKAKGQISGFNNMRY